MTFSASRSAVRAKLRHKHIYVKALTKLEISQDCLLPHPEQSDRLACLYHYLEDVNGPEYDQFCAKFRYSDYAALVVSSRDHTVSQNALACFAQCTFSSYFDPKEFFSDDFLIPVSSWLPEPGRGGKAAMFILGNMCRGLPECGDYVLLNSLPLLEKTCANEALGHFVVCLTRARHEGVYKLFPSLLWCLLKSNSVDLWTYAFKALANGLVALPETFTAEVRDEFMQGISDRRACYFAQVDLDFAEQFWRVLARYAPLPTDYGVSVIQQMEAIFQKIDEEEERRTAEMKGRTVAACVTVFEAHGDEWRELGGTVIEMLLPLFGLLRLRVKSALLTWMNSVYDFAVGDDLMLEVARLQIELMDNEKVGEECLRNLLMMVQRHTGNETLRRMLLEEMPRLQDCFDSESERRSEIAHSLILEIEGSGQWGG
jgi:hypothetical protein